MKSSFYSVIFLIIILFIPVTSTAWECDVTLNAPKTIKMGQEVTLSANGTPTGGSYSWSRTKDLTPHGATATLIGHKPTYSEYIQVIAYYRTPKGKKCKDVKWIWACTCNVTSLNGPATAKVGQKVALTAEADSSGGTFTWTLASGTGTLTANGSSAEFTGDKAGTVEVKVSYVPPDGGEPCTKYHTIEIEDECEVTLTADMYQRPICRDVNLTTEVSPAGGTCSWAGAGINGNGCSAIFNKQTGGNDTVTVTYTTPGGTTCDASASILTYSLDGMDSKKNCFESGTALQQSDFDFFTTPAGFSVRPVLSPTTVTTNPNESQSRIKVTASQVCDSGSSNDVSTVIDVVNENVEVESGVEIEIPNLIKQPLEKLGLADKLNFSLKNSYKKSKQCCLEGPGDLTSGETAIEVEAALKDFTIYGVPLPRAVEKYFTFNALQADLTGKGNVLIQGERKACSQTENWNGGGNVSVELGIGSKAKVKIPYVLIQGEVKGETDVKETLSVGSSQITANGQWGGVVVKGTVIIRVAKFRIKPFEITQQVIESGTTPTMAINLPTL